MKTTIEDFIVDAMSKQLHKILRTIGGVSGNFHAMSIQTTKSNKFEDQVKDIICMNLVVVSLEEITSGVAIVAENILDIIERLINLSLVIVK